MASLHLDGGLVYASLTTRKRQEGNRVDWGAIGAKGVVNRYASVGQKVVVVFHCEGSRDVDWNNQRRSYREPVA